MADPNIVTVKMEMSKPIQVCQCDDPHTQRMLDFAFETIIRLGNLDKLHNMARLIPDEVERAGQLAAINAKFCMDLRALATGDDATHKARPLPDSSVKPDTRAAP